MKRPDPVRHMMLWGTISSALVLLLYFLARGLLIPAFDPYIFVILVGGIFTGFTLGGMAGVIIGTAFQHEQEAINSEKIYNRRNVILIIVFVMVLIISRLLILMAVSFVEHPLTLSILGAIIASFASHHYLLRLEAWLRHEKPKRKHESVPERLLDEDIEENDQYPYEETEDFDYVGHEPRQ